MKLQLRHVNPADPDDCAFMYHLLAMRLEEPHTNISHVRLPSFKEHLLFVQHDPYVDHYIIELSSTSSPPTPTFSAASPSPFPIGAAYLTRENEIGLFILKAYRCAGFGRQAVEQIMLNKEGPFFANINPVNLRSVDFFRSLGFLVARGNDTQITMVSAPSSSPAPPSSPTPLRYQR